MQLVHTELELENLTTQLDRFGLLGYLVEIHNELLKVTCSSISMVKEKIKSALFELGWVVVDFFDDGMYVQSERVFELSMAIKTPLYYIDSEEDLTRLKRLTLRDTIEEATKFWHKLTGGEVIDHRDTTEYTNCNAQRDVEFFQDITEFDLA